MVSVAGIAFALTACGGEAAEPRAPTLWMGPGFTLAIDDLANPSRAALGNGGPPDVAYADRDDDRIAFRDRRGSDFGVMMVSDDQSARLILADGPSFMMRGQPCAMVVRACAALFR